MLQPPIFPLGIRIDEPVTTLTDLLVATMCFYAYFKLRKLGTSSVLKRYTLAYFLLMGLATALGGLIGHGFLYALGFGWKLPGWLLSMLAINLLERVIIRYSKAVLKPKTIQYLGWFNIVELLVFAGLAFGYLNFRFVEIHSMYGLLIVVFGFCVYNWLRGNRDEVIVNFMKATLFAALAAVVFILKLAPHQWFNHADFAHIFMFISAWFFYRGSRCILVPQIN